MLWPRQQKPTRGDNDEEQPCLAGSAFDDCAFPSKRTSEPSIRFQLHEADTGLRRQAAIAKCKAWTDPIHTKSVRGEWPAKPASIPTTESSGQASGRCRSG